jgi:two-component system sensor histidine kinase YesM
VGKFRTSLSHGQEYITIWEETEHVRNYLYLQKTRHGDKYNYLLEIDPQILGNKTIKLILQPLVENAIYHGVRELEGREGLIRVKGNLVAEKICFEVVDNGAGMSPEQIIKINRCLKESEADQRFFGLRNVHERIVLAYGPEYGLELRATPGGGVTAVLWLPTRQNMQEGSEDDRPFNGGG